ncbi:MAG: prepilin-type N-terminal cleavage/methylation domain-containing protein [Candidatus Omnitrophota bacterium]
MKITNNAFTLIELMIACTIMIITIVGIFGVYQNCGVLNESARNLTVAINDARIVLERMKTLVESSLSNVTGQDWTVWAASNGCNTLNSEQINVSYNSITSDPIQVTLTVTWQELSGRNRNYSISTLLTEKN